MTPASLAILPLSSRLLSLRCDEERYVGRLVLVQPGAEHPPALAALALATVVAAPPNPPLSPPLAGPPSPPPRVGLPKWAAGGDPPPPTIRRAASRCRPGANAKPGAARPNGL